MILRFNSIPTAIAILIIAENSKNIVVLILLTLSTSVALAQQETAYLFYRQNMNLVNPAYAGLDGKNMQTGK